MSYQGPLLSKHKKAKRRVGKLKPLYPSRLGLGCVNSAKKLKVALRRQATMVIEDVPICLFNSPLQIVYNRSLDYSQNLILLLEAHTVTHPCMHNGKQRPQPLQRHVHTFRQKQRGKGTKLGKDTVQALRRLVRHKGGERATGG